MTTLPMSRDEWLAQVVEADVSLRSAIVNKDWAALLNAYAGVSGVLVQAVHQIWPDWELVSDDLPPEEMVVQGYNASWVNTEDVCGVRDCYLVRYDDHDVWYSACWDDSAQNFCTDESVPTHWAFKKAPE